MQQNIYSTIFTFRSRWLLLHSWGKLCPSTCTPTPPINSTTAVIGEILQLTGYRVVFFESVQSEQKRRQDSLLWHRHLTGSHRNIQQMVSQDTVGVLTPILSSFSLCRNSRKVIKNTTMQVRVSMLHQVGHSWRLVFMWCTWRSFYWVLAF